MQHKGERVAKFLNIPETGSHTKGIFVSEGHDLQYRSTAYPSSLSNVIALLAVAVGLQAPASSVLDFSLFLCKIYLHWYGSDCWREEGFCSPVIGSQSLVNLYPWAINFTSNSQFLCSSRKVVLELDIFFPPDKLGSGKIVSLEGRS